MATGSSSETHSLDHWDQIEEICDRFESAVRAGKSPQIEEFLDDANAAIRQPLLMELLIIEWDHCRGSGDTTRLEDEIQRFPDNEHTVREAHRRWRMIADVDTVVSRLTDGGVLDENTVVDTIERLAEDERPKTGRQLINLLRREGRLFDQQWRRLLDGREAPPELGDYELLDVIGNGAMGRVYKARQQKLDRIVAVKVIRSGEIASDAEVSRFYAEAEAAAKLSHPNIVPVYDVGEHEGRHFFSMGYVEGRNLKDILDDGPLPPKQAAEFVAAIADAVQYGHDNGVVHRDIKPSNMIVDASGQPKVLDFGLAKRIDVESEMTKTGDVLGTPSYMSPEQARGDQQAVGSLSDVYSLGALLYALLVDRPPFQAANVMETLNQVLQSDPVPPRQLNPDVPADLETVCLRCLEKEPDKRYASAADLAADLRRWLNGEPIHARPATRIERFIKWAKRKPAVASALVASIIAVSALVGVLVGAVYNSRLQDSNSRLQESLEETASAKDATEKALGDVRDAKGETERALAAEKEANQKARRADYYRRIAVVREEWENGNAMGCFNLLNGAPREFRGWEWDYLRQLWRRRGHSIRLAMQPSGPNPMALLSNSRQAVVVNSNRSVSVFDLMSGRELRSWEITGWLLRVSTDERLAANFRWNGQRIDLTNIESGKRVRQLNLDPNADREIRLLDAVFTNDDKQLLGLGWKPKEYQAILIRFNVATGAIISRRSISTRFYPPQGGERCLARHGNDQQVIVRLNNQEFAMIDTATATVSKRISTILSEQATIRMGSLQRQPNGNHLATLHYNVARLWNTDTWAHAADLRHDDRVTCLTFHPTKPLVITGSDDRMIRVWDLRNGRQIRTLRGHVAPIAALGATDDGGLLWSLDWYGHFHKWNLSERDQEYREVSVPFECLRICLAADGKTLLAGGNVPSDQAKVAVIDRSKAEVVTTIRGTGDVNRAIDVSRDGRLAVSGSWDTPIEVRDASSGELIRRMSGKFPGLMSLTLTPDDRYVVSAYYGTKGEPARVAVWDVADGTLTYDRTLDGLVWDIACHPGGKTFVAVSGDSVGGNRIPRLTAFHTGTGEILFQQELRERGHVLAFSPSGDTLAVSLSSQTIELRSFPANKRIRKWNSGQIVAVDLAYSPGGRRIAAPVPGGLSIWDVENGQQVLTLKHPTCSCLAFTPDGYLISGGRDGTIRIWDGRSVAEK